MGVRVSTRYNADGSVTKRTTYARKTIWGTRKSETFVGRTPKDAGKVISFPLHLLLCGTGIRFIIILYY